MSVGERISELRKEQNLSQLQFAKILSVSRQAVSKWENGLSVPDSKKMIQIADVLDTDIEYLTTGRRNFGRRPPVVLTTVETVEKVIEKPVIQVVEKIVEVEKPVIKYVEKPIVQYIEKPVIKKVYRTRYVRNRMEYALLGIGCFLLGFIFGAILL